MFDGDKTRMTGLPYGEKYYDNTLSRFHTIPERYGQTDRIPISILLTRDKNWDKLSPWARFSKIPTIF